MQKILVIGCPGSGKTTFSRTLAEKTGLPLVHLDGLYWCGEWEHRGREEFDALLEAELERPRWIMDGNFNRTIPRRLACCDTVFYLDLPTATCLWGAIVRTLTNRGRSRPEMGGHCVERMFDKRKWEFLCEIARFKRKNHSRITEMLENVKPNVSVVIFKRRRQVKKYLKELRQYI